VGQHFNKHRSKARSQAPGLETTSVSITVWISGAGKCTVMVRWQVILPNYCQVVDGRIL
jgi:hypothetical protein